MQTFYHSTIAISGLPSGVYALKYAGQSFMRNHLNGQIIIP